MSLPEGWDSVEGGARFASEEDLVRFLDSMEYELQAKWPHPDPDPDLNPGAYVEEDVPY